MNKSIKEILDHLRDAGRHVAKAISVAALAGDDEGRTLLEAGASKGISGAIQHFEEVADIRPGTASRAHQFKKGFLEYMSKAVITDLEEAWIEDLSSSHQFNPKIEAPAKTNPPAITEAEYESMMSASPMLSDKIQYRAVVAGLEVLDNLRGQLEESSKLPFEYVSIGLKRTDTRKLMRLHDALAEPEILPCPRCDDTPSITDDKDYLRLVCKCGHAGVVGFETRLRTIIEYNNAARDAPLTTSQRGARFSSLPNTANIPKSR